MMLVRTLAVADRLAEEGIEVEVIDPRTRVPLDVETIVHFVRRTNRLLICHEAVTRGGWAGEVAMAVMPEVFDYLDAPIARVGARDVPVPFSGPLENEAIPGESRIEAALRELIPDRSPRHTGEEPHRLPHHTLATSEEVSTLA
jgi:pyruvate/2-oxoglutarate/acetoin dehydrogenase E1 component